MLLCLCWIKTVDFSHGSVLSLIDVLDVDLVGVIADAIHDCICQSVFTIADLAVPVFLLELRAEDGLKIA